MELSRASIGRRSVLVAGALAGATWVAPSVIGLDRVAAASPSVPYSVVYSEDFEGVIGSPIASWSTVATANPTPARTILGRFTNDTVGLMVALPAHECLQICFDLYVNDSWDADNPTWGGPDMFGFAIDGAVQWNELYDTANAPAGGTIIEGPAQLWFNSGQPWTVDRVIHYCCLLYTSDAADE